MEKYLVGGAVRDRLLDLPIKERDWVVVGSTPQEMLNIGYHQVGKDFPVFLHPKSHEEYALARTERKSGFGYTGFICNASPKITLEEDLYRRDLTINAIACDEEGNIIDPYHGQKDMKLRLLRHVSKFFNEDPLRVLRVARFAAQFSHLNFYIHPETMNLMKDMNNELLFLSPERIWAETKKALNTKNPEVYFQVLLTSGALKILFPEINALFGIPNTTPWRPEIDTGIHTMMALSISVELTDDISVRFATLCHDLGKGITPKNQWPNHQEHAIAGIKLINNLCKRLKIPTYLCKIAKIVAKYHELLHEIQTLKPKNIMTLFNKLDIWRQPSRLEKIIITGESDARGHTGYESYYYPQGNFLREAFKVTKSVSTKTVIADGFIGAEINNELNFRRQLALSLWKQQKS